MSLARNQSSSLQRRMVRKSSFSSSPGAPRKDSRSPLSSRESSFNDGGPLNVTYELHRMHGTPRAARFLDFVTGKRSPEPFLCWTALEKLVEEVRDNTLESADSRARKVIGIVEEFVLDSGANQLGLSMGPKEKLNELYRKVKADPDFWDGRPLLMLQREAELMLLPDVREFAESHPWRAEDVAALEDGGLSGVLRVSTLSNTDQARRTDLLKKMHALIDPSGRRGKKGPRMRRATLKLPKLGTVANLHASHGAEQRAELTLESHWCRVSKYEVLIGSDDEPGCHAEWVLPLTGIAIHVHTDAQAIELQVVKEPSVFVLQFDDTAQFSTWQLALEARCERLQNHSKNVAEKRDKILSMGTVPPPPKRPSTKVMPATAHQQEEITSEEPIKPEKKMSADRGSTSKSGTQAKPLERATLAPGGYQMFGSMSDLVSPLGYGVDLSSQMQYGATNKSGYNVSAPEATKEEGESNFRKDSGLYGGPLALSDQYERDDSEGLMGVDCSCSTSDVSLEEEEEQPYSRRDDFNEIFQQCVTRLRELEAQPPSDEVSKLRTDTYVELIGLAEDFVTSAKRYGEIIISEVYLPLSKKTIKPDRSVGGVIGGDKYVVHNILFKFALDRSGVFGHNDESAAKVAGLELKGLQAYMSSNTPDLCYPLMALIDYKGFRLVASSLLPLTNNSLHYGSQDAAVTIKKSLPALTERIEQASASLNLKLHEAGKDRVVMATAVDIEGHLGKDNRMYLLDFSRVFPPVTPNRSVDGSHLFQMFRPEFVKSFTLFPLCSDAYSNFTAGLPDAREHAEEIDLATNELLNVSVSNFVAELIARMGEEARIAGSLEKFALTQLLHSHGINVRYLGEVVRKMGRHPFGLVVLTQMVARVVKIGFRRTLRSEMARLRVCIDEPYRIAAKDFLNRVFSASEASEEYWANEVPQLLNERFQLRPGNWNAFPKNLKKTLFDVEKVNGIAFNARVAIFREVRQSLGLEVAPSLVTLLETQPKVYAQASIFDDVDVEKVGLRVKFLDVISNAQGYVFSKRAAEKEQEGFYEAAKSLYDRAYNGYQAALSSCPNDSILLRNCALVMTRKYRLEVMSEADPEHQHNGVTLLDADPDDPWLFSAQQNFKKAIQANRKSPVFYASYADYLMQLGNWGDSEAHYLEALLRDPFSISTMRGYAHLLRQMGQTDVAGKFEERAAAVQASVRLLHSSGSRERIDFGVAKQPEMPEDGKGGKLVSISGFKASSDLKQTSPQPPAKGV